MKFGAPPHGGIALGKFDRLVRDILADRPGFDRLIAILAGAKSIRDVIAFPKTTSGVDPVFKSPSATSEDILKGYGLKALHEEKKVESEKESASAL